MSKRTKWSVVLTLALAAVAIGFVAFLVASDNPKFTPLMVRNATVGVLEVALSLIGLVWFVWYLVQKRSRT